MKYAWIAKHRARGPITLACEILGVGASGYFEHWRRQDAGKPGGPGTSRRISDEALLVHILAIHAEVKQEYGWPKIWKELLARGIRVGKERVRRLMQRHGIKARGGRKFVVTTDSKHDLPIAPNLLARNFTPAAPNRVWSSDIIYIATDEGWLYLTAVTDLFSRQVVGWSMREHMQTSVVANALRMAWFRHHPAPGPIFHSDRGSQGGFNRSSQHWVVDWILDIHLTLRLVSSSRVFFGAGCSAHWRRRGSPGPSIGTGRYLWGSIAGEGHSCFRSCRAAMDCGGRRRSLLARTQS